MRISDILKQKKTFSFEVFPPNPQNSSIRDIFSTIDALQQYRPDFISVTFKASGDYAQNTIDLAAYIQQHTQAEPLVHLTCGALDKKDIDHVADILEKEHLENVLALRGDKPANFDGSYLKHFKHASELMQYLRQNHNFCLGGARSEERRVGKEC